MQVETIDSYCIAKKILLDIAISAVAICMSWLTEENKVAHIPSVEIFIYSFIFNTGLESRGHPVIEEQF